MTTAGSAEVGPRAAAPAATGHATRQAIMYCPYCAEETLFPLEKGWECRSCMRAFTVAFLGLTARNDDRAES